MNSSENKKVILDQKEMSEALKSIARQHGIHPVTLGQRILRAETAAIAAATLVGQQLGAGNPELAVKAGWRPPQRGDGIT